MRSIFVGFYFFVFCSLNSAFAQKERLEWIFGSSGVGLRFDPNDYSTTVTTDNFTPYTREGCTVVSNPVNGALMFYTDGIRVVDSQHSLMPNGSNLIGNVSSSQSGLVCVKPGNCSQFYVFHNDRVGHEYTGGNLFYSIIDLALPGNGSSGNPLGDVVDGEKNKFIDTNTSEGMAIVPDKDGSRFWLISPKINSDIIRIYVVDVNGIRLHNTFNSGYNLFMVRSVRYSDQHDKIAIVSSMQNDPTLIFNFDPKIGVLSSPFVVPGTPINPSSNTFTGFYDAEWSSDGTKLYFSRFQEWLVASGKLYQYDLNTPEQPILLIHTVSGSYLDHSSGLKRGPDDKIYHLYINPAYGDKRRIGVINNPNEKGVSCDYDPIGIDIGMDFPLVHKFPEFLNFTDLDFLENQNEELNFSFGSDTLLCAGETLLLNALNDGSDFLWSDGSTTQTISVNESGEYSVRIKNGCSIALDTIVVSFIEAPSVDLGGDRILCAHEVLILKVDNLANEIIQWSTGSNMKEIEVNASGEYFVRVSNQCGVAEDYINVMFVSFDKKSIPNVITPNGDTYNDFFIIDNNLRGARLKIVNRWGKSIYFSESYQNDWNAENVSPGTYYYTLGDICGNTTVKGFIQVIK
jgi:gliding motility-associated-like protein